MNKKNICIGILFGISVLSLLFVSILKYRQDHAGGSQTGIDWSRVPDIPQPEMIVDLLTINEYSRPGISLPKVDGIVVHYTANPGTDAKANRDYFENLKDSHTTKVSSHFIIGLDGTIYQCIPTTEIAYASNDRNMDTISIECCHPDDSGKFTDATYDSLVELTAYLARRFEVKPEKVIRHYDVTGKNCPKFFVEHPEKFEDFREAVKERILSQ
ncbi:MAG: peptidoglycan recognition protein family protein [Lachnospiraceae bacterium]|nr:peptidoglycan recognition protein family protein [Lachnospiraceae bacterium]